MSIRSMVPACVSGLVLAGLFLLVQATPDRAATPARQFDLHRARVTPSVYTVQPGPEAQREFLGLLIQAIPGDVIELAAGKFNFDMDLEVSTNNITIRGKGPSKTILSFKNQHMGSKGIEASGDNFVIEDLAVEDTRGNAIKVVGAKNVIFRNVRTEWTGEPKTSNGAYGVYPVSCENVLIDGCIVRGAADAGVYVGQSRRIVVKNCYVTENVAGIEIENSFDADVYDNYATNNSGGILVFDLPGLDLHNGGRVRVFHNKVPKNNHANFGAPGSSVSNVAPGTGMLLLAMDNVEIFDNEITDNNTAGLQIISYLLTGNPINDPHYDPYPEHAYIHDNHISGGGKHPGGRYGKALAGILGKPFPEIFYDGAHDPKKLKDGKLPPELGIRFERNGNVGFADIHLDKVSLDKLTSGKIDVERNIAAYTGHFPRLPGITLPPHGAADPASDTTAQIYRNAPHKLSEYGFFEGNGSTQKPVAGVVPYDLNTPLFSDYTSKHRFVRLPAGKTAAYREDDAFDFPVGTQIVKTFAMPHDMKEPREGRAIAGNAGHRAQADRLVRLRLRVEQRADRRDPLARRDHDRRELETHRRLDANEQLHRAARQPVQELPRRHREDLPSAGSQGSQPEQGIRLSQRQREPTGPLDARGHLEGCTRCVARAASGPLRRSDDRFGRATGPHLARCQLRTLPQPGRPGPHNRSRPPVEPEQSGEDRRL